MNLWAKHSRQLVVLAVASFFFSCQDETSFLGYPNPSPKFNIAYVDIPIGSSVLLMDSVRTSNFDATNDLNRFMIGKTDDPVFGSSTASSFAQFYPAAKIADDSVVFDSLVMHLRPDFYVDGANGNTNQKFNLHRINEPFSYRYTVTTTTNTGGQQKPFESTYSFKRLFYNKSTVGHDPAPIGTLDFPVDYAEYVSERDDPSVDEKFILRTRLDNAFGEELLTLLADTAFTNDLSSNPDLFFEEFHGIAIVPEQSDKVVRFNPDSIDFRLYYHTLKANGSNKDTLSLPISIGRNGLASFNAITTDRSGAELATLTSYYEEFDLGNDKRYIQAGTGIVTKLDFSKFVEFAHSDTIEQMVINSAELIISNVDDPDHNEPPSNLLLTVVKENNRPKKLAYPGKTSAYVSDLENINRYQGYLNFDRRNTSTTSSVLFDSTFNIVNDQGNFFNLSYSSTDKKYSGTASLFFQQLFVKDESKKLFTDVVLIPYAPARTSADPVYGRHVNGKSLNRVSFDKNNIMLRVYYTVPTVNQNQ
ncbi:MAG TPA: DUF4270 family protein [Ohtaekwangia sp.]|nr:DUF4270 family protein [Ohtaekwangia sp.]